EVGTGMHVSAEIITASRRRTMEGLSREIEARPWAGLSGAQNGRHRGHNGRMLEASGVKQLTTAELEAGLDAIRQAPKDAGVLEMIVRRPQVGVREELTEGELDREQGLVGDGWSTRASTRTRDGSPHPDMQLNVMNSRVIALLAQDKSRWQLAGDQLFIDMD